MLAPDENEATVLEDQIHDIKQDLECLLKDPRENEMKVFFFKFVRESLTHSKQLFVNLYHGLFAQEKKNKITKEKVEECINLIIDNPSKWISFIHLPSTINGYTSPFLHIYLRKNYSELQISEPRFLSLSFINFIHELGHWIRRKINEGEDLGLIYTPCKNAYNGKSCVIVEFGAEVEKEIFGETIDYICNSDVESLRRLTKEIFLTSENFRNSFQKERRSGAAKGEGKILYRNNKRVPKGAIERGKCALAIMRGL